MKYLFVTLFLIIGFIFGIFFTGYFSDDCQPKKYQRIIDYGSAF